MKIINGDVYGLEISYDPTRNKGADELTAKVKDLSSAKLSSNLERPAFVMGRVRTSENNTMNNADYIYDEVSVYLPKK